MFKSIVLRSLLFLFIGVLGYPFLFFQAAAADSDVLTFEITSFEIEGNTIFSDGIIENFLKPHTGEGKTADDVEAARDKIEKYYHSKGYPTVIVNIPEQSVEGGLVRLEVIESKIRRVRVTGNRYFTMEKVLKDLPSIRPGSILYLPDVQTELMDINRNPDIKVAPVLIPGKELGTIDIDLKVKDKLPLHASLEINNRYSKDTEDLRLNGMISYDNLWQKEHSASIQFQTTPEDTSQVRSLSASYIMPALWGKDQMLVLYALASDSDTTFGEGFEVLGKGFIVGLRNIIPFPEAGNYYHNASIGIDYKDFKEDLGFDEEEEGLTTPISYMPVSVNYAGSLKGETGLTRVSFGLNFMFRGLASDLDEFQNKRYGSTGNHLYVTAGIERYQNLPKGFRLVIKADGQIANQPLISNEQYIAGGMTSVRGYKESEEAGDHALHGTLEIIRPNLIRMGEGKYEFSLSPYVYYDGAQLYTKDALPGQEDSVTLQGAGGGIRGAWGGFLEFEFDGAMALWDTDNTESGDKRINFRVKAKF